MPAPRPERRWPGITAGYAVFTTLLAIASTPIYRAVEPVQRSLVARVSAALLLGVVAIHLTTRARARIDAQPSSDFEVALEAVPSAPKLDSHFVELRDELAYSIRRFRYFDRVLWPRLLALWTRLSLRGERAPLSKLHPRSFGRGPSLPAVEELITRMERPR